MTVPPVAGRRSTAEQRRVLTLAAASTVLVLVTFVTPLATGVRTAAALGSGLGAQAWALSAMSVGLAATLLTAEVTREEASANVTVDVSDDGLVTGLEEKPDEPTSTTVATELFVYQLEPLLATLREIRAELSGEAEGDDSGARDGGEVPADGGRCAEG